MTTHTQGPWTIAPGHDGVTSTVKIGDSDRFTVYLGSSGAPAAEWNANARLIAAAPKLLAALKAAEAYAALNTVDPRQPTPEQLATWRAAIAEAEGQS